MSAYDYEKQDPHFKADLERSKVSVDKAARWLCNRGLQVVIEPTFVRESVKDMGQFRDTGDLKIFSTVEVKHRPKIQFNKKTGFQYPTIIVDTVSAFHKSKIKPLYYIIYNADYSSMIFVDVHATFDNWKKVPRKDHAKSRTSAFYEVDVKLCTIIDCK